MQGPVLCSFCGENTQQKESHPCTWEAFELLNSIVKPKSEQTLFNEAENLVFQGGGVKGISYLGVLNKLASADFKPNNFLSNIKRVAGTSAGSLTALYLALKLDEDKVIKEYTDENENNIIEGESVITEYLRRDYATLLDPEPTLTVHGKEYSRKQIMLSLVAKTDQIKQKIKDNHKDPSIQQSINTSVQNIVSYIAQDFGLIARLIAFYERKSLAGPIVEWLVKSFSPHEDETRKLSDWSLNLFGEQTEQQKTKVFHCEKFKEMLHNSMEQAVENVKEQKLNPLARIFKQFNGQGDSEGQEKVKKEKDSTEFLDGEELDYAVSELIKYVMRGHESNVGLFPGKVVMNELILKPIQDKLKKFPHIKENDPTFGQLASYTEEGTNMKLFRELYVTAFNVQLGRTEIFSAWHTPDVKISEAVRASISIPIFFEPVKIMENGMPRVIYQEVQAAVEETSKGSEESSSEEKKATDQPVILEALEVDYMDGGVLDNYPIWIFDDLRYCMKNKPKKWNPEIKFSIHNPKTIGFRILDENRYRAYVRPYYDTDRKKLKAIAHQDYKNSFRYLLPHMLSGVSDHEENVFLKEANWPRSIYINNLGVSSIAFNLTEEQKNLLMKEGEKSIDIYMQRAQRGSFFQEGQIYPVVREEAEPTAEKVKESVGMLSGIYNYFVGYKEI